MKFEVSIWSSSFPANWLKTWNLKTLSTSFFLFLLLDLSFFLYLRALFDISFIICQKFTHSPWKYREQKNREDFWNVAWRIKPIIHNIHVPLTRVFFAPVPLLSMWYLYVRDYPKKSL